MISLIYRNLFDAVRTSTKWVSRPLLIKILTSAPIFTITIVIRVFARLRTRSFISRVGLPMIGWVFSAVFFTLLNFILPFLFRFFFPFIYKKVTRLTITLVFWAPSRRLVTFISSSITLLGFIRKRILAIFPWHLRPRTIFIPTVSCRQTNRITLHIPTKR
jgi:hypothetical protein